VLTFEATSKNVFARHTQEVDYALVEGVMGLFDGATGTDTGVQPCGATVDLPVLLVIDCSRLSRSVAATPMVIVRRSAC